MATCDREFKRWYCLYYLDNDDDDGHQEHDDHDGYGDYSDHTCFRLRMEAGWS